MQSIATLKDIYLDPLRNARLLPDDKLAATFANLDEVLALRCAKSLVCCFLYLASHYTHTIPEDHIFICVVLSTINKRAHFT